MKSTFYYILIVFLSALSISCGNTEMESVKVTTEPSDKIIRELRGTDFSIVLNDMNISEKDNKRLFEHKYHILKIVNDSLEVDSLSWKTVNQAFFMKHEKDLGMEIVSNHGGNLSRNAQPVGFGWAIGNPKYGEWEEVSKTQDSTRTASTTSTTNNGSERRWRSHGPSVFFWYWMLRRPAYQRDYAGYRTASAGGRSYYGSQSTTGSTKYGTNSNYQKTKRQSFFNRRRSSNSWKSYTTSSSKSSRSSSRYKTSSSTRSRSGGFGK